MIPRFPLALAVLGSFAGCTLDASVVSTRRGAESTTGGTADDSSDGGSSSTTDAGTAGTSPYGKVKPWSSINPFATDTYQEHRFDWCLPPAYDAALNPSERNGCKTANTTENRNWTVTLLVDRSESMNEPLPGSNLSKWLSIRSALELMIDEPRGFLDQWSLMTFAANGSEDTLVNCNSASYAAGEVATSFANKLNITPLLMEFDLATPIAPIRPTAAALEAAIAHSQTNAALFGNASRPSVVLITDGLPYGCFSGSEESQLINVATSATTDAPVYVVQLGNNFDLTRVAEAGKTNEPYVVIGGDVVRQLVKIFRRILYPAPSNCELWGTFDRKVVNPAALLDFEMVMRSRYTGSKLAPPLLPSPEACSTSPVGGFWVADSGNATEPYSIGVCPCTCAAMGSSEDTTATMFCSY